MVDLPDDGVRMQFGDKEILVPALVLATLPLAWPLLTELKRTDLKDYEEAEICCKIVELACSVRDGERVREDDPARVSLLWLSLRIRKTQFSKLVTDTIELLKFSGLLSDPVQADPPGEAPAAAAEDAAPPAAAALSPEIAPPSSLSSSATE